MLPGETSITTSVSLASCSSLRTRGMRQLNLTYWPEGMPRHLSLPQTSLWYNLEVSAIRYPDNPGIVFYDSVLSYGDLKRDAEYLAGFLMQRCGVKRGDRVGLFLHNSPQFVIG